MISYFKYTDGTAFTLDGAPYRGMLVNVRGKVYAGSIASSDSRELSSNNKFISQIYTQKYDFNFTYNSPLTASYNTAKAYPRSILSYEYLSEVLAEVNKNNVLLYSKMFKYNNDIFNMFAKTQDIASTVYCLTGEGDSFTSKKQPATRLPHDLTHPFYRAHNITPYNSFFVTLSTKDEFNYYNTNNIKFAGSINSTGVPLSTNISHLTGGTVYFDKYNKYIYHAVGTKYNLYYYDYSAECGEFGLLDRIDISLFYTDYKIEGITFGRQYRCAVIDTGDGTVIEISGIRQSERLCSIKVDDIDITTVISTCQRFEDDAYAILYIHNGKVKLRLYDISRLVSEMRSRKSRTDKYNIIKQLAVYDGPVSGGVGLKHTIEFAPFDSDVIICKLIDLNHLREVEFRSISNPRYPLAVFNGYTRMGYLSEPTTIINEITIPLDTITSSLNNYNQLQPIRLYDMQFDVQDTIRTLMIYKDSVEVQSIPSLFKSCVDMNLTKKYIEQPIVSNSSVGAVLNANLHNIVYDTFTLYKNLKSSFDYERETGRYIGQAPIILPRIRDVDLYVYENESINIGILDRIFTTLLIIQQNIIRAIT